MKTILLLACLSLNAFGAGRLDSSFQAELSKPFQDQRKIAVARSYLSDKHVLFARGAFHDIMSTIMSEPMQDALIEIKTVFNVRSVSVYDPSSMGTVQENVAGLLAQVKYDHAVTRKPIVLITHSLSGTVAMMMLLQNPQLMLDGTIDRVIMVQASLAGTPGVEDFLKWGRKQRPHNVYLATLGLLFPPALAAEISLHSAHEAKNDFFSIPYFTKALESLVPSTLRAAYELEWNAGPISGLTHNEIASLSSRILYARSTITTVPEGFHMLIHTHAALNSYGSNDGWLLTEHQKFSGYGSTLDNFGTDLGTITANHFELAYTLPGYCPDPGSGYRRAFMRALLESALN